MAALTLMLEGQSYSRMYESPFVEPGAIVLINRDLMAEAFGDLASGLPPPETGGRRPDGGV